MLVVDENAWNTTLLTRSSTHLRTWNVECWSDVPKAQNEWTYGFHCFALAEICVCTFVLATMHTLARCQVAFQQALSKRSSSWESFELKTCSNTCRLGLFTISMHAYFKSTHQGNHNRWVKKCPYYDLTWQCHTGSTVVTLCPHFPHQGVEDISAVEGVSFISHEPRSCPHKYFQMFAFRKRCPLEYLRGYKSTLVSRIYEHSSSWSIVTVHI